MQQLDDDRLTIDGLDWSKPIEWSTGERFIEIDGPSFDGGFEVRAPIEFAIAERETSCMVWDDGRIAHPRASDYAHLRYMPNCFYAGNSGEIFSCVKNPSGTGGYVVSKRYPMPKLVATITDEAQAESTALAWLEANK